MRTVIYFRGVVLWALQCTTPVRPWFQALLTTVAMLVFIFFFFFYDLIDCIQRQEKIDFTGLVFLKKTDEPHSVFIFSWASVQHVLSNSRPDWDDWGRTWSHGCNEYPHTLQPSDASNASTKLPGPDQWTCCRYSTVLRAPKHCVD